MGRKWSLTFVGGFVALSLLVSPVMTYGNQREDVKEMLKRLEEDTNNFKKSLDSALDSSPLDGSKAEDEVNDYVDKFRDASKRLSERYEDRKYAAGDANEVLVRARRIDTFMRRHTLNTESQNDWQTVRNDLELLARTYSIRWKW